MNSRKSHVQYTETTPDTYTELVFYTWELVSSKTNTADFTYIVLPDACIDIIFDLAPYATEPVFIMRSQKEAERISLGAAFHYAGIRLLPGAIHDSQEHIQAHPTTQATQQRLVQAASAAERHQILMHYIEALVDLDLVARNVIFQRILQNTNEETRVQDLEAITGYSSRQLQRLFIKELGFGPRDFLKIIRFQVSLGQGPHWYADQSHFIKEYRRITGITPKVFSDIF